MQAIKSKNTKIESNIERDKIVNETLLKNGWKVTRFWGEDIKKNLEIYLVKIETEIDKRKYVKIL